jgi:uncharacterized caspase-like protein
MKKLLGIMVLGLLWCNTSFGESKFHKSLFGQFKTIHYFGIEGININDNLLSYFEKQELAGMEKIYDEEKNLTHILISSKRFETYDQIQISYRKIDKDVVDAFFGEGYNSERLPEHLREMLWIKNISGIRHYPLPNSYESCKLEKNGVVRFIKKELDSYEDFKKEINKKIYRGGPKLIIKDDKIQPLDDTGKSMFSSTSFILEDGGSIKVACYKWSNEFTKKNGWVNALIVSFDDRQISTIAAHEEHIPKLLFGIKEAIYASTENYYALIIGNNNYEHLEKLDAAENDARVLSDVLKNNYGFKVKLLLNADYDTTVNSLHNISKKLSKDDNLLIFYAGHGELDKKQNRGYWLPVDASYELRSKWISNAIIADELKATEAKHVLLIVDSCFAGSLMRSGNSTTSNQKLDEDYIKLLQKKKTRLIIASGGNEPVMDSDGGEHSVFAQKLIDTLKENKSVVSTQKIFENIRKYVAVNAEQTPERAAIYKAGHDGGDFLFFVKNK